MVLFLIFVGLLLLTFLAAYVVTRPPKSEVLLQERLETIGRHEKREEAERDSDLLKRTHLSEVPLLDVVLRQLAFSGRLQRLMVQADVPWTVGRVVLMSAVLFTATAATSGLLVGNLTVQLVLGVAAASVPLAYLMGKRSTRMRRFSDLLPEGIDLISRSLRAGHSITAAIEMVAREISDPVGPEFQKVFEQQNFGLPLREALNQLAQRMPAPDLKFLVTAILVQKETGGNLIEVLDKASAVIRERLRLKGQLRIYTAQGKLTGYILGGMPFFLFAGMSFINPGYAKFLLEDPLGRQLVLIGLGLMAIGVWVIRKIVDVRV